MVFDKIKIKTILAAGAFSMVSASPLAIAKASDTDSTDKTFTEVAGECPDVWTAEQAYKGGDLALFGSSLYFAKWWTQGQSPESNSSEWAVWKKLELTCDQKLSRLVEPENIINHLNVFDQIATDNDGNRFAGSKGHEMSLAYIRDQLEGKYELSEHEFSYSSFQELSPPEFTQQSPVAKTYLTPDEYVTANYSGSGEIQGNVVGVDLVLPPATQPNTSSSGCEANDFYDANGNSLVDGQIALVQRGSCSFKDKAENAQDAGQLV